MCNVEFLKRVKVVGGECDVVDVNVYFVVHFFEFIDHMYGGAVIVSHEMFCVCAYWMYVMALEYDGVEPYFSGVCVFEVCFEGRIG